MKRIISLCLMVFMLVSMIVPVQAYEWNLVIPDDSISFDNESDYYFDNNTDSNLNNLEDDSFKYNNSIKNNKINNNFNIPSGEIIVSPSINGKNNVSITGGNNRVKANKNDTLSNQTKDNNTIKMANTVRDAVYSRGMLFSFDNENLPITLTKDGKGADASVRFIGDNESKDKLPNGHGLNDYITRVNNQKDTIGYCINPFKYGVYPDNETTVNIVDTSQYSENDRKILGIMTNGYPQKSPSELGVSNDMQAYYATQVAIQHFCFQYPDEYPNARSVKFDNDSWEHWWGNDTVVSAAKQIYQNGISNPYTEQSINLGIAPSNGYDSNGIMKEIETDLNTGEGTFEIELTVNPNTPFEYGKLVFNDTLINDLIKSGGKNKILVGGNQVNFQTGILGFSDYTEGIKVLHGQNIKIVLDKLLAESYVPSSGTYKTVNYVFIAEGNAVKSAYVTKNLNEGYKQDYVILQPGTAKTGSQIMWTKETTPPPPPDITIPDKGNLKILKYNNKTNQLVGGAIFNVRGVSEGIYDFNVTIQASAGATIPLQNGGVATPGNGTISFTGLKPGQYQITEITPPPDFDYCELGQNSKVVTVEPDATIFPQVEFFNNPYGQLKIKKIDSITGNPVNGTILRVRNQITGFENEYTTMNGGIVNINNLPQGNYEISEVYAPNSYIKSNEVKTATIVWGETTEITYSNTPKTALCLTKVDAETGDKLEGARFTLKNPSTGETWELESFVDGTAFVNNIPSGTYTLVETLAPNGYILNSVEQTVVLVESKVNEITIQNSKKSGIQVKKVDESGNPIAGVQFNIYKFGENTPLANCPIITDAKGIAILSDVVPGDYEVQEIQAAPGYKLDTTKYPIKVTNDTSSPFEIVIVNKKLPGLTVRKVDYDNTTKGLIGAEFTIEKIGGADAGMITGNPFTTDDTGIIQLDKISEGTYKITETKAPLGYEIDKDNPSQTIDLKFNQDNTVTFRNKKLPGLTIRKVDFDEPTKGLAGAEFTIEKIGGTDAGMITGNPFTTDKDGVIYAPLLMEGTYRITETKAPLGYEIDKDNPSQVIDMKLNQDNVVVFRNLKKATTIIEKRDRITKELLQGAVFEIFRAENNTIQGLAEKVGDFITDEHGQIELKVSEYGWYYIREKQAPNGYLLDIPNEKFVFIEPNKVNTVLFLNSKKPTITVHKKDDETKKGLEGAFFEIWRADNNSLAGLVEKVGEYYSDEKGQIILDKMEYGWYCIKEIKPPKGYLLADPNYKFIFFKPDEVADVYFENAQIPTIIIEKKDVNTGVYLKGATFELWSAKNNSKEGLVKQIGTYTTDETGKVAVDKVLEIGWYCIKEIKAPEGYLLSDPNYQFIFIESSEDKIVTFENILKPTLKIIKRDIESKTVLAGAKYEVWKSDNDTKLGLVEKIDEYFTDEKGQFEITDIDYGWYYIKEIQAPKGYLITEPSDCFIHLKPGENGEKIFEDFKAPTVTLNKIDSIAKAPIKGAKFRLDFASNPNFEGSTKKIGEYVTDTNGKIEITEDLQEGWYRFTEIEAPLGFQIKGDGITEFFLKQGENKILTVENIALSAITIKKIDGDTDAPLGGAYFTVSKLSDGSSSGTHGTTIADMITNSNGLAVVTGLTPGAYLVEETKAPEGYMMVANPETVWLNNDTVSEVTVTFENRKHAGLGIKKMDAVTKEPLANATFKITDGRGANVGTSNGLFRTDDKGFIFIPDLKPGAYVVQEIQAPDGYILDNTPQTVDIVFGKIHTVEFFDHPVDGLVIVKYDSVTKEPLKDAVFEVEKVGESISKVGTFRTDINGTIQVPNLKSGSYSIQEIEAPQGYILDNTAQVVNLKQHEPQIVEFFDNPLQGLTIVKMDAVTKEPLANAVIKVTDDNDNFIGEYRTDSKGTVTVSNIKPGLYKVQEIKAPAGYILDSQVQLVKLEQNKNLKVELYNNPLQGLTIVKYDAYSKEPLVNAVIKVMTDKDESIGQYTTDSDGMISVINIKPGAYKIQEIQAPKGYILDNTIKQVWLEENKPLTVELYNKPLQGLSIIKMDSVTKEPLANAVIKITDSKDTFVGEYTTDETGTITLTDIKPGMYKIQETKAPEGYLLDNTVKLSTLEENKPLRVDLYNHKLDAMTIIKMDSITKKPLENAIIKVTDINDTLIGEYRTDETGIINISNIKPGNYKVQEVKAPTGYILDNNINLVKLEQNKPLKVELFNHPLQGMTIIKYDSITKEPLADAKIKVMTDKDEFIGEYITDKSGQVTVTNIEPGAYKIQEIQAPKGYILDNTIKQVWLEQNRPLTVELYNKPLQGLTILKLDSITKEPLANAVISVTTDRGEQIGEYTTDKDGTILVSDIKPGAYKVQEIKAPNGYILDNTIKQVWLDENKPLTVTLYNSPLQGLSIIKMDAVTKEPLENAVIKITTDDDTFVGEYRTDKTGIISVKDLKPGLYKVQETKAPEGYLLDDTMQLIRLEENKPIRVELFNNPLQGLTITKLDAVTRLPLAGAVIRVTKGNDEFIGEYRTDNTGTIILNDLKPDFYKIQETSSPNGYILDNAVKMVELKQGKELQLELTNTPMDGITIVKLDGVSKKPLANAVIKVTTADDKFIGEYRTDATGTIVVKGLVQGTYKIMELSAPESYQLDDTVKLVHLKQGEPQKIEIFNYKLAGIQILKRDSETAKPLAGAKFEVRAVDERLIGSNYITDEKGIVEVTGLEAGHYTVKEIVAPKGYALNNNLQNVEVKTDKATQIIFENEKMGTIRLKKIDYVTKRPLEGAKFKFTNVNGKVVGEFVTDRYGEINLEYVLEPATYLVQEIAVPKGYALDTGVRKMEIGIADEKMIEWANYPLASLSLIKVDSKTKKPISDVEFEIFNSKEKSIGKFKTDNEGKIELESKFAEGTYYIREVAPKEGYMPNEGVKAIDFKWGKTLELKYENIPIEGQIEILKTSADNNPITGILADSPLKGAEFTVYNSDGVAIETLVTNSNGTSLSKKLAYGRYIVKETKAPAYYKLSDEEIIVEIKNQNEIIKIERKNQSTLLAVNVEKSGYKEAKAGDTMRYDIYNIQNTSVVPLDEFYLHESIPVDATRITRIFTGTYNQNLNYTIMYKTNLNEQYKPLKENLFTNKVYEIDCTQGLQKDEYITDIRFDFGKVDVGFRDVERAFVYCKILDNLPNNYQFTNVVETGGRYDMQVVKAKDSFTTMVFVPTSEYKGKLPKTGR